LHLKGAAESVQYRQEFKSYVGFLEWANELSEREKKKSVFFINHGWRKQKKKGWQRAAK
jgi:hypothetical protein